MENNPSLPNGGKGEDTGKNAIPWQVKIIVFFLMAIGAWIKELVANNRADSIQHTKDMKEVTIKATQAVDNSAKVTNEVLKMIRDASSAKNVDTPNGPDTVGASKGKDAGPNK